MVRQVAMRHLGIIEDYALEQAYITKMIGISKTILTNYNEKAEIVRCIKSYPRKHERKIFLFGYQAIGGSEYPPMTTEDNDGAVAVSLQE